MTQKEHKTDMGFVHEGMHNGEFIPRYMQNWSRCSHILNDLIARY